jgi:hypothetical protein
MRDSIVIDMQFADYDIIDGTPNVHRHHIFEGTADRKLSDEDGLWVPLSYEHHEGNMSVHRNKEMRVLMHIIGQLAWEKHYIAEHGVSEEEARSAFARRYRHKYI